MKKGEGKGILELLIVAILMISAIYVVSIIGGFSGAIVTKTTVCYDTDQTEQYDDGRNYYEAGTVSGTDSFEVPFSYTDACSGSGQYLREHWCDKNGMRFERNNFLRSELHYCENGCSNNKCNE